MSTVAEIQSTLQSNVEHTQAVSTKLDNVIALVQSLRDQVAGGGVASQQDLDAIMAAAQAVQGPLADVEQKEDSLLNP